MKYYQLSSGNGPSECELAVAGFLAYLIKNYNDIHIIETMPGHEKATFRSVYLETEADLSEFAGTLQWICKSPYRPHHGRKNWFFSLRAFDEKELEGFDEKKIQFQTMRAGGPGGQHVNKVETAIRATYLPTGYTTVCIDERSQLANKKEAIARLKIQYMEQKAALEADGKKEKWTQHNNLERGDAVACFRGEKFVRV